MICLNRNILTYTQFLEISFANALHFIEFIWQIFKSPKWDVEEHEGASTLSRTKTAMSKPCHMKSSVFFRMLTSISNF